MLARQSARYVAIAIVVVVFFFPIYWMLITSMKPQEEVLYYPPTFVPPEFTFRYYAEAFDFRGGTALINSLIVTSIVTVISTVLGTLGGYAFARYKVGGFHLPFWILSTRMMPQVAAIIPLFLLMQQFGMIDRYGAVIAVHLIVTLPFAIWMMRSFFLETPVELEEAALMDGASKWQLLMKIAVPLAAPGIAMTALFSFVFSWNEFLFALVLTRRVATTLPVVISGLYSQHGVLWPVMTAVAAMGLIPIFILAVVAQRYLVRGLTLGAIK
ncbi:MAG: carbohydrate ABC transporter permease [Immundisolibacterales bacterium]|nr:carbohydrate ABC transporter permease [Immundisolibacterales bacterium]